MSSRKLQQECDKLQKKIVEGLQIFDDIHDKIAATDNSSQKERLEGDLRKEIKKLQRSRDQVKQWLGDSSVKLDKNLLQDSRSKIENAMERFKEVERVSKMKQFSNEGLEMQTKLGASDIDEAKKNEASKYLTDVLEELGRQNELLSGELSTFTGKKKLGNAQLAIEDLNTKIDRNNMHIGKLEQVLHNLANEQLKPEKIDEIKDDLDYYVENNQAPDFIEYDEFYENLELEDEELEPFPAESLPAGVEEKEPEKVEKTEKPKDKEPPKEPQAKSPAKKESSHVSTVPYHPPASAPSASTANNASTLSHSQPLTAPAKPPTGSGPSAAAIALARAPPPGLSLSKSGSPAPLAGTPKTSAEELKKRVLSSQASAPAPAPAPATPVASSSGLTAAAVLSAALNNQASPALSNVATSTAGSTARAPSEALPSLPAALTQESKYMSEAASRVNAIAQNRLATPLPFLAISQLLESSLLNCPDSSDAERPRQYNPQNVHPLSVDYPQEPMFELNSAKIMSKFDNDTLFFCFYYSEGQDDLAKYNAACELSRRGWVFNSETKQWFSKNDRARSRSASLAPGEDESGESYKYFDYQSSWLIRRKDNFSFKPELQQTF